MTALSTAHDKDVRRALPYVYRRPTLTQVATCARDRRNAYDAGRRESPQDGLTDAMLQAAWRRAGDRRLVLRSRDGHSYRVLYPGRPAPGRGPDFIDAVVERDDGVRIVGDVEVHVRLSGWSAHGHEKDTRYNGVVLHVVSTGTDERPGIEAMSAAGRVIPLLVLGAAAAPSSPALPLSPPPEYAPVAVLPPLGDFPEAGAPSPMPFFDLGAAGDQRFMAKSSGFELEVRRAGADQAMYAGVMECLGYPRNTRQFMRLADRIKYPSLVTGVAAGADVADTVAGRLLWAAGLAGHPDWSEQLSGSAPVWDLPGGRPDNHPARRLAGMAALVSRWQADGPVKTLSASTFGRSPRALIDALFVRDEGTGRALIGRDRAGEIAVNAVLPCVHAWARVYGHAAEERLCLESYRAFPRLEDNAVTTEARKLLAAAGLRPEVKGAREQQGLHMLYRAMGGRMPLPAQLPML